MLAILSTENQELNQMVQDCYNELALEKDAPPNINDLYLVVYEEYVTTKLNYFLANADSLELDLYETALTGEDVSIETLIKVLAESMNEEHLIEPQEITNSVFSAILSSRLVTYDNFNGEVLNSVQRAVW